MRIAFVCQLYDSVLPPRQNSIGIWTYEVAQRLAVDHEVTVVAPRRRGTSARMTHAGIAFEFVRCVPSRAWEAFGKLRRRLRPNAAPHFARRYYAGDYVALSIRRLRDFEPDVIHVQNFPNHLPAYRKAFPRAMLVLHMHCDWLVQLDRDAVARDLDAADLVVGCSRYVTEAARARFGHLPLRFAELPNGTRVADDPQATLAEPPETILFVGRVSPEKGVHVLLEAWPRILAARPQAKLEVVGPFSVCPRDILVDLSSDPDVRALARFYPDKRGAGISYEHHLRDMLPEGLAGTVRFIGSEPHDRLLSRVATAALLVNPSLSEAFGMSLVEALGAGTPVVGTRVGGMSEIVEATGGGVLVEKADPEALAEAVVSLLSDPAARSAMAQRGRERVGALYSWERVAALAIELYEGGRFAQPDTL